ncbi:MAG: hypothetical protein A2915_04460 [Candidatus Yanofskybacteria bacterium RIFCSPLOWO2_01_FULL_41_34]|uniref:Uncharacterized protein n=1 Tax=Candidatus Yanofskybacteria bacterium RIFCSPHIGHO2_01_FULL_41_26 TaxID=1802661 RepID=A0A1F8EDC4_9BACT|nr:MAG: hypothetical protein A2649_03565 [Candidatus Yanofskybacteria bacterium RIFCSPHIGHO2_01_FULL_41_26]OGN21649.1 MAG: hypothetical protein A2915_04460 [Candidatus Yanofskybacteria bacterium RIFCSPLOWO2_01_FULL_41_34]
MNIEKSVETKDRPPINLKTHPDETMAAMIEIEGPDWIEHQKNWSSNTLSGAIAWLRGEGENDTGGSSYIVHGLGGMNRYYVDEDGSVRFSRSHASPKDIALAESLGFQE